MNNDPRRELIRDRLKATPNGASIRKIAEDTDIPRSTVGWLLRSMVEDGEILDGQGRHKAYRPLAEKKTDQK